MSTYTGCVGILLATGATVLLARLGIVRHRGTTISRNGSSVAAPTLSIKDTIAARSGPWTAADRRNLVEASSLACEYLSEKDIRIYPYEAIDKVKCRRKSVHIFLPQNYFGGTTSEGEGGASPFRVAPGILCGQNLESIVPALAPTRGGKIIKDGAGFPIAELVDDSVFILVQCTPMQGEYARSLYQRVLAETLRQMSDSTPSQTMGGHSILVSKEKVESLLPAELQEQNLELLRTQQAEQEHTIAALRDSEQKCLRSISALQLERSIAQELLKERCQQVVQLKEALNALPQVEAIHFSETYLSLLTSEISCVHPLSRTRYVLGKYRIYIYYDGSEGCVRWYNVTKRLNTYRGRINGPHIDANGRMRAGEILSKFPQMIGERQYLKVAKFAIKLTSKLPNNDPEALALLELYR